MKTYEQGYHDFLSGGDFPAKAGRAYFDGWRDAKEGKPMAAKKKKRTRKTAKKKTNPRKHIPKTTRGRKASGKVFSCKAYDKQGRFLGNRVWRGISIAEAENRAARLVTGKVHKVILEY